MIPAKNVFRIALTVVIFALGLIQPAQGASHPSGGQQHVPVQSLCSNLMGNIYRAHSLYANLSEMLGQEQIQGMGAILQSTTSPGALVQRFTQRFDISRPKVKILVLIFIYLAISIIVLSIFILISRTHKTRKREQAKKIKAIYQEELANYLFGEKDQPFEFTGIKLAFNRKIFMNELLSLHNNLSGEAASLLKDLYYNLDLYKDSLSGLKKGRWDQKAKGFREVSQMDVKDARDQVSRYINSKNPVLRIEAQIAMVKLSEEDPLNFLDDIKFELSIWEQINIANALETHHISIESFQRWFTVANDSVVIFALRMTGLYKHSHAAPDLIPLLEHDNPVIRHYAIEALGRLELPEFLDDLKKCYYRESPVEERKEDVFYHMNVAKNRKAVMQAISQITTDADIDFLVYILETEKEFDILLSASQILANIKPEGMKKLDALSNNGQPHLKIFNDNVQQNLL